MTAKDRLDRFLRTDPSDVGCDEALEVVHVYAELVARDPAGAAEQLPGVAVHLAACGPCREDLTGLLAAMTAED
ncbi:MAG: hypothetical protein QM747_13915 [Nocardioides sp.]